MKAIVLFLGVLILQFELNVSSIRKEYKEAVLSKSETTILFKKLQKVTKDDSKVLFAYKGAVTALVARQQKGVKNKQQYFKKGIDMLEYALKSEPNNIEIRFIRLTIQQNSPKFLKYNKQEAADKAFIFEHLKNVKSAELKEYITGYILQSKNFTKEEKNVFSQQ